MDIYFADLRVRCTAEERVLRWFPEQFTVPKPFSWEIELTQRMEPLPEPEEWAFVGSFIRIGRQDGCAVAMTAEGSDMAQCIAVNDREIKFYVPNSGNETKLRDNFSNAFRFLLESTAALRGTVSVHACAVVKDGKAYAFVGNSGAGKSTHGLQWVNHLGAEMISGDRSLIQCKDGEAIIHGVPWDGKEQLFRQVSYPLHGVVEIRKSSQNTMCRLSAAKARRSLPGQFVLPAWDANAFAYGFSTIMSLARIVPCFRLFCTPDEQGARRCYDGIMNRELLPVTDDPDIVAVDERFYEDSNDAIPRRIMRADQCGLLKQLELPVTVAKAWQLLKNPVSKRELTAEMAIGADKSFEQIEREATQAVCWLKEHALVE